MSPRKVSNYAGNWGQVIDAPNLRKFGSNTKFIVKVNEYIYLLSMEDNAKSDSWFNYPTIYRANVKKGSLETYRYSRTPRTFKSEYFCQNGFSQFIIQSLNTITLAAGQCTIRLLIKLDTMEGKYFYEAD